MAINDYSGPSAGAPPSRKILTPLETASLIREPGHDCFEIDLEVARAKMDMRSAATFQRFLWAEKADCRTERGNTRLNGASAHCKRRCEAAHASFTPNLIDDKLERIAKKLKKDGSGSLSSFDQKYLMRRLGISRAQLHLDSDWVLQKIEAISPDRKECSLSKTVVQLRNSTFHNPVSSNQVDSKLEKDVRVLEDELSLACTNGGLGSVEAMAIFSEEYIETLAELQNDLQTTKAQFERFVELEKILFSPDAEHETRYDAFIKEVREFLFLKEQLMNKKKAGASVYDAVRFFHNRSVYLPLQALVDNYEQNEKGDAIEYYLAVKGRFSNLLIKTDVLKIEMELANKVRETELQLDELVESHESIPDMPRLYYGVVNHNTGERRAPKSKRLQPQLLNQLDVIPK